MRQKKSRCQPAGANVSRTFGFNPASQITSRTRDNDAYAWTGGYAVNRTYSVNGLNQYTTAGPASFTYDANGNLTSDGSRTFTYDEENRLVAASGGVTLRYDPLGRLYEVVSPSGTRRFVWDGDALVNLYNGAGTLTDSFVHGANAGADDPLVWYDSNNYLNWLHADHQGSITGVTNGFTGSRINAYDEWGIPVLDANGNNLNTGPFQYTGQLWLPELGMYHYKARIYSPTLGRFLQVDPVGYKDQINLYAYVGNDPVDGTDPTGNWQCQGSTAECATIRRYVNQFHVAAHRAQSQTGTRIPSAMARAMLATSAHLGPEADFYGPTIRAGQLEAGTPGQTSADGSTITLDLNQIRAGESRGQVAGPGVVGHEGTHSRLAPSTAQSWGQFRNEERLPYWVQSYTDQMLGNRTLFWDPTMSWATRIYRVEQGSLSSCLSTQADAERRYNHQDWPGTICAGR